MASGDDRATPRDLDASGLRIGIVSSRWNATVVDRLIDGVQRGLASFGLTETDHVSVPGAFEIPIAAKHLAQSGEFDGLVVVGAVIRGETTHYELVAGECGRAIMDVQLDTGVPIGMGILTVEDSDQAMARSEGPGEHNVGEEAAAAAIELAHLFANRPI